MFVEVVFVSIFDPMDNFRVYKHNSTLRDISDLVGGKKGKMIVGQ